MAGPVLLGLSEMPHAVVYPFLVLKNMGTTAKRREVAVWACQQQPGVEVNCLGDTLVSCEMLSPN